MSRKADVAKLDKWGQLESTPVENKVDFEGQKSYHVEWCESDKE